MGKNDVEVHYKENRTNSSGIVPIDKNVVHKICSGQVVLSLAVAVKELLENSLDAGATAIDIRLVDHGSTLVEVADNGSGIKEDDFEGIALKHHTSKLSSFSDLDSVGTFGFRGEALSSLCSLCGGISVLTCHSSATCATLLQFDSKGIITKKTPCARQVGTTVSLESLFSGLPVRRKEFLRNVQREFAKMTHLLYAYCLVSTGVRITCTNRSQKKGGHSSVVVATQGGLTVRDNIACVFGHKQLMTVVDFKQKEAPNEILEEFGLKRRNSDHRKQEQCESELEGVEETPYAISGCLSSCEHGKGRGAPDRQFFFINSRPCEPIKVMKLVNEVYHQYNSHQNPFVFLDIKTDGIGVDVNVTPDKRKIFIENEKMLLATVKASLLEMYASTPRTFQLQNLSFKEGRMEAHRISTEENAISSNSLYSSDSLKNQKSSSAALSISQVLSNFSQSSNTFSTKERQLPKRKCNTETGTRNKQPKMDEFCTAMTELSNPCGNAQNNEAEALDSHAMIMVMDANHSFLKDDKKPSFLECPQGQTEEEKSLVFEEKMVKDSEKEDVMCESSEHESHDVVEVKNVHACEEVSECDINVRSVSLGNVVRNFSFKTEVSPKSHSLEQEVEIKEVSCNVSEYKVDEKLEIVVLDDAPPIKDCGDMNVITMNLSIADVTNKCHKYEAKRKRKKFSSGRKAKFMAAITPKENGNAETELQREITKEMFSKMRIIGQFNLGFIVTQLDSDLFIIDQHASDEKYNFETLQLTTILQQQPLVVPQPLDLTAASKAILMENLEVFEKNGFKFSFPPEEENCKTCLTSIPFSQNWTFGKEDVDELIFMLQDSSHANCRPSRVRDMFASRACRKSVMIGTALSTAEMRQLVENMGLIEQPWNCPHGRPTMRHLINLDLIL